MLIKSDLDQRWDEISQILNSVTGCGQIVDKQSVAGGSINAAYRVSTAAGEHYFIKLNNLSRLLMFEAEAEGLAELRKAGVIRVPEPVSTGATSTLSWLATEYIQFGPEAKDSSNVLGEQLAALHHCTTPQFGWHRDNTIGSTPQMNCQVDSWVGFYRESRLRFQFNLAARNGFTGSLQSKGERLMEGLDLFFTTYQPGPSLLHGDLWGGNRAFDHHGQPVLFDPAVYFGDREADIAMTELFGGFSASFHAAYRHSWPMDEGYPVRKNLYNLYHILNHANLFGASYISQAEHMIDGLLAELA